MDDYFWDSVEAELEVRLMIPRDLLEGVLDKALGNLPEEKTCV